MNEYEQQLERELQEMNLPVQVGVVVGVRRSRGKQINDFRTEPRLKKSIKCSIPRPMCDTACGHRA